MKKQRIGMVWLFFAAVYGISGLLLLPVLLSGKGMSTPLNMALVALMACVPSVMGILFTYLTKGAEERRDFWRRTFRWPREKTKMAMIGLLLLPLLTVTTFLVSSLLSGKPISLAYAAEMLTNWKTLLAFLFIELTFGPLSEEFGWRGYALDELQSRWSALGSSLVLGVVWAVWHTAAFLIPGTSQYAMGGLFSWAYIWFLMAVPIGNIFHTWIYNNTGRSILVAGILMHFARNASLVFLAGNLEGFTLPPAYHPVELVMLVLTAGIILLVWNPRTLTTRMGSRNTLIGDHPA
jgi:CAAX protease family protein